MKCILLAFIMLYTIPNFAEVSIPYRDYHSATYEIGVEYLEKLHYSGTQLSEEHFLAAYRDFIHLYDPHHILMTEIEVEEWTSYFKTSYANEAAAVQQILLLASVLQSRTKRLVFQLSQKFQMQDLEQAQGEIQRHLSPRDSWPKDEEALQVAKRNFAIQQLQELVLRGNDIESANQQFQAQLQVQEIDPLQQSWDDVSNFLTSLGNQLDNYSRVLSPTRWKNSLPMIQNSQVGIGVQIQIQDEAHIVKSLIPEGSAQYAGVKEGDILLGVFSKGEFHSSNSLNMESLMAKIMGEPGSMVHLRFQTPGEEPRDLQIPRRLFRDKSQKLRIEYWQDPNSEKVFPLVRIKSFYYRPSKNPDEVVSLSVDMEELLMQLEQDMQTNPNIQNALILDMRNNIGGDRDEAVYLAELFLPNKAVYQHTERSGRVAIYSTIEPEVKTAVNMPLSLIVDSECASACELFAGAIQDYQRGVVIGHERTFGKGSVQYVFSGEFAYEFMLEGDMRGFVKFGISDLSADPLDQHEFLGDWKDLSNGNGQFIHANPVYTVALYALPSGAPVHGIGIQPDVVLPHAPSKPLSKKKDILLEAPQREDRRGDFSAFHSPEIIEVVKIKSSQRVQRDPYFQAISKLINWQSSNLNLETQTLNWKQRKRQRDSYTKLEKQIDRLMQRAQSRSNSLISDSEYSDDLELQEAIRVSIDYFSEL